MPGTPASVAVRIVVGLVGLVVWADGILTYDDGQRTAGWIQIVLGGAAMFVVLNLSRRRPR